MMMGLAVLSLAISLILSLFWIRKLSGKVDRISKSLKLTDFHVKGITQEIRHVGSRYGELINALQTEVLMLKNPPKFDVGKAIRDRRGFPCMITDRRIVFDRNSPKRTAPYWEYRTDIDFTWPLKRELVSPGDWITEKEIEVQVENERCLVNMREQIKKNTSKKKKA